MKSWEEKKKDLFKLGASIRIFGRRELWWARMYRFQREYEAQRGAIANTRMHFG